MSIDDAIVTCPCCGRETNTPHCSLPACTWVRCVCGARINRDGMHSSEGSKRRLAHGRTGLKCTVGQQPGSGRS